jgi:hypothetical protein
MNFILFLTKMAKKVTNATTTPSLGITTPAMSISQPIDGQIRPNLDQLQATSYILSTFDYLTNVEALI